MTSEGKVKWKGKSGNEYTYHIYSKQSTFKPNQDGNYIFAKQAFNSWKAVYIGQGDLKTRTQDETHLKCANKKEFTHYHVRLNNNESNRLSEETDMIQGNLECLEQNGGCNKTITGQ